jgi:hypothetical protein
MGLLASGLLASASTAWALKGAADRHELETPTAERLQVGLMTMAATALVSFYFLFVKTTRKTAKVTGSSQESYSIHILFVLSRRGS